jgi:hypothetical protein
MEKIRVSKEELLSIVNENRDKHVKEYLESIKAYRVKAADLLTLELQKIVSGEKFQINFDLIKPESHEKEYELTIKMLNMSVDDIVEIEQNEFNELVNDEWNWKGFFKRSYMSNSYYVGQTTYGTSGSSGMPGITGSTINFADDEI